MSNKKSIEYSLGIYLANHVIDRHMPSLYHEAWTKNVISTTWGEYKEIQRLEEAWFSKLSSEKARLTKGFSGAERYAKEKEAQKFSEDEWNELMKYRYTLKEKYLPHTIKVMVPNIDFSDEETNEVIKAGFISCMWDSDHCEYSLKKDDISFENEIHKYGENEEYTMTHSWITMKLSLEPPSSFTGDEWIEIKTPQKDI